MPEFIQIILSIIFLIVVFVLTRFSIARRIRRTATLIIKNLVRREAFDPRSAADLPYAKQHYFRIGMRDKGLRP
jgi:hypothetical protein